MYEVAKGFCLVLIAWLQLDTQQNPTDIRLAEVTVRIAQLVERWSNKPLVLGSIPNVNTLFFFSCCFSCFSFWRGDIQYTLKKMRLVHLLGCVTALCDPSGDKG